MTTDLILKVDARDLARVAPFSSDMDVRYYLNGVYVEPHAQGAILAATNGHVLAVLFSEKSYAESPVILAKSKRLFAEVRKAATARSLQDPRVELRDKQSYVEVVASTGGIRNPGRQVEFVSPLKPPLHDGKFPDWRKVIPRPENIADGLPGCVKADYIKLAVDAAVDISLRGRRSYGGVSFQHDKNAPGSSAIVVRSTDARDLILVIMPMRYEVSKALPDWTQPPPPPPPAADTSTVEPEKAAA